MRSKEIAEKFELYILSLWLLFLLIVIVTVDIPVCLGAGCQFIGIRALLVRNVVPSLALMLVGLGALYYLRFDYKIAGSKSISVEVSNVKDINYEHLTFLRKH